LGKELKASLDIGPQESLDEKVSHHVSACFLTGYTTDSNCKQDVDPSTALKLDDPALKQRNARKLLECVNKLEINIMNAPRKGKKLLVLDLDYTILVSEMPPICTSPKHCLRHLFVCRTVSMVTTSVARYESLNKITQLTHGRVRTSMQLILCGQ
jgi:hypothetical protein